MNLLEAIESQKPFRRKGWIAYVTLSKDHAIPVFHYVTSDGFRNVEVTEMLATDWEVEEPTVTITASEFWRAVDQYRNIFWPDPAAACVAAALGIERIK